MLVLICLTSASPACRVASSYQRVRSNVTGRLTPSSLDPTLRSLSLLSCALALRLHLLVPEPRLVRVAGDDPAFRRLHLELVGDELTSATDIAVGATETGKASCRERVWQYV